MLTLLLADGQSDQASAAVWITFAGVLFAAICSVVAAVLVSKTRGENATQHLASQEALQIVAMEVNAVGGELRGEIKAVHGEVREVGTKIDSHIGWHAGHDSQAATSERAIILESVIKETT